LETWFTALADRLRHVRIMCGDWRRVLTPSLTTKHGLTGVFLDPPYGGRGDEYATDAFDSAPLLEWCREHGAMKEFRVVLAGYEGLDLPGWRTLEVRNRRGHSKTDVRKRERLYLSPGCCS
jgi:site-specific DNA-adenine methylase